MYYYHVENCDTSWVTVSLSCRCRKLFVPGTYPAYMERWFYGRRQDEDGREGSWLYRLKCELATFKNASSPEPRACTRSQSMVEGNRCMLEAGHSKETPRSSLLVGDCTRWVLNSRVCTCLQIGNCRWSQELGVCLLCLVE